VCVCARTLADMKQAVLAPHASHLSQSIRGPCNFHDPHCSL